MKKAIVTAVVMLFLGVISMPSVNYHVVKAAVENDFITVASEACGIPGLKTKTVHLTAQQYANLERYCIDFQARLNQTTCRQEAIPLYYEAVQKIASYGLLPKGMSIAQAQKLVTGVEPSEKTEELLKKILDRGQGGHFNNTLCLLAGNVDRANCWSLLTTAAFGSFISLVLLFFFLANHGIDLVTTFSFATFVAMALFIYGLWMKPINLVSSMDFTPGAKGSIFSIGLSGVYREKGEFGGGISGFTGLRIMKLINYNSSKFYVSEGAFFFGSALTVYLKIH